MTKGLITALSLLSGYLSGFAEKGFDPSAAERIISLCDEEKDTPFSRLSRNFGLERFEKGAVLLCLLVSLSPQSAETASSLCGCDKGFVTPSLAGAVFFGTEDILAFTGSLGEGAPLARLLEGVCPRYDAGLGIKSAVLNFLSEGAIYDEGFSASDDRKMTVRIIGQQRAVMELDSLIRSFGTDEPFIIQLTGAEGSGRHTCAKAALEGSGRGYIFVSLRDGITLADIKELSLKLVMSGLVPVVSVPKDSEGYARLLEALADETGLVIAVCERALALVRTDTIVAAVTAPTISEQYELWKNACRGSHLVEDTDLAELTGEFDMTAGAINKAVRYALALYGEGFTLLDIKNACSRSVITDMGSKAQRLDCVYSWEDLVLPGRSVELLIAACQQVRLRHAVLDGWGFARKMPYGRGVSMIFTGPPGTGKTMAAQVVAAELGMDIYRISLANVVSKYIGETEKNLSEIFDKARLCRCILFFDEADALFSRRTEVKDSNDKYSNMEAAFLLQKIEEYSGVVILATNLVQNFDEAFKRRMRFIIDFPFPDENRRRELWRLAFPEGVPLPDVDFDFLVGRFELSGSNIRNIALHSAFLAASENSRGISMRHVMAAVRNEYAKSGKAFTKADAGEYYFEQQGAL